MIDPYLPLRELLVDAGCEFVEPAIIHDAGVFVEVAGEELRRRLFLTSNSDGKELALRPDYTIPVCLRHLAQGAHQRRADYAYLGPVFRQRGTSAGEFLQAGVEFLGRTDRVAADADTLRLALVAADRLGVTRRTVRIGDASLFNALVAALDISPPWRQRLTRIFGDRDRLATLINKAAGGSAMPARNPVAAKLGQAGRAKVRRTVAQMLEESGLATIAGRQADEITGRFMEKIALREGIGKRAANILTRFLAIEAEPAAAIADIRAIARRYQLDLGAAADRFDKRIAAFEKRGIAGSDLVFAADFGRRLDYYTGFVFEIHSAGSPDHPVIGGGRYDHLLAMLGAQRALPAVGFAIWLERIGATS